MGWVSQHEHVTSVWQMWCTFDTAISGSPSSEVGRGVVWRRVSRVVCVKAGVGKLKQAVLWAPGVSACHYGIPTWVSFRRNSSHRI